MSETNAKPSSFSWEMYACSSTFTLALGSSMLSFIGIGTLSISFCSSNFSSWNQMKFAAAILCFQTNYFSLSILTNSITNLSDSDVLEFRRQGEDPEKFDFTQGRLQQLVVRCYGLVCQIVVAANPSQFCHLKKNTHQNWSLKHEATVWNKELEKTQTWLRSRSLSSRNSSATTWKFPLFLSYLMRLCLSSKTAAVWMRSSLWRSRSRSSLSWSWDMPYSVHDRSILMYRYV